MNKKQTFQLESSCSLEQRSATAKYTLPGFTFKFPQTQPCDPQTLCGPNTPRLRAVFHEKRSFHLTESEHTLSPKAFSSRRANIANRLFLTAPQHRVSTATYIHFILATKRNQSLNKDGAANDTSLTPPEARTDLRAVSIYLFLRECSVPIR